MLGVLEFPRMWSNGARRAIARHQRTLAQCVPQSHLVNPTTVITRRGTYQRSYLIKGRPWETTAPEDLWNDHRTYAAWVNSLPGGEWIVHRHTTQRRVTAQLTPIAGANYSAQLEEDLARRNTFLIVEHHVTLEKIPPRLRENMGLLPKLARWIGSDTRTDAQIAQDEAQELREFDDTEAAFMSAMSVYEPEVLGNYEHAGVTCSRLAEFLAFNINGTQSRVRADCGLLPHALPHAQLYTGPGVVELAACGRSRYAALLDIKDYVNVRPGALNGLLLQPEEWVQVQSFEPMVRRDGVEVLNRQHNHLQATEDVSVTQRQQLKRAADAVQDGIECIGHYAYVLAVFGETAEAALASAARIKGSVMNDARGLQMAEVRLLADDAWKLLCPGNFGANGIQPRRAELTNEAFCALSAPHGTAPFKRFGHPWGEVLWLARTFSGRAYGACPHASPPDQDVFGEKLSANMLITGMTGSGKSTLTNVLLALTRRWNPAPRLAWLDYNESNKAFFLRMGGIYLTFSMGEVTGLNPFRRPRIGQPTPEQVHQWCELVKQCVLNATLPLLPSEEEDIARAVQRVAQMQPHMRSLTRVRENLTRPAGGNSGRPSVYERLARWCRGGEYEWVFDGEDTLPEPEEARIIAFDYTQFLDRPELSGPLLMALMQYLRSMLGHGRIIIGGDEVWKGLTNDALAEFFRDMEKTARFQDAFVVMTTQEPADAFESRYGRTNISQTATLVALADEGATHECYVERMGWSEDALHAIRDLRRDGTLKCLWWQKSVGDPVMLELPNLSGMHDHLAILSGAKENLPLLDAARAQAGDDPEAWAPVFLAAVRERRARNRELAHQQA